MSNYSTLSLSLERYLKVNDVMIEGKWHSNFKIIFLFLLFLISILFSSIFRSKILLFYAFSRTNLTVGIDQFF